MGRLEVKITHGHDNGPAQWGAVVALIVLVLFAAAGHREIGAMLHEVLTIVEIAAASAVGLAALIFAVIVTVRVRRANRRRRERTERRPAMTATAYTYLPADDTRPALGAPRSPAWPTPAEWDEIERRADYRRNS